MHRVNNEVYIFKKYTTISVVVMFLSGAFTPVPGYACSYTMDAIGLYYLSIAELQRLQLKSDGDVIDPLTLRRDDGDILASKKALENFSRSMSSIKNAIKADEDEIDLLPSMYDEILSVSEQIANGTVPTLKQLHKISGIILSFDYMEHCKNDINDR